MASGPITSCQVDGKTMETDFIVWAPKSVLMVTAAMKLKDAKKKKKRCLLLGIKDITNLDSILKSRDITLTTKVGVVKVMFFPVVVYECESWTIKKAER